MHHIGNLSNAVALLLRLAVVLRSSGCSGMQLLGLFLHRLTFMYQVFITDLNSPFKFLQILERINLYKKWHHYAPKLIQMMVKICFS